MVFEALKKEYGAWRCQHNLLNELEKKFTEAGAVGKKRKLQEGEMKRRERLDDKGL